jgi:hypothetical protein
VTSKRSILPLTDTIFIVALSLGGWVIGRGCVKLLDLPQPAQPGCESTYQLGADTACATAKECPPDFKAKWVEAGCVCVPTAAARR